ncbi:hypothetical protein PMAYCL1PPCAC_15366, partial [Pristionchus mayeri]
FTLVISFFRHCCFARSLIQARCIDFAAVILSISQNGKSLMSATTQNGFSRPRSHADGSVFNGSSTSAKKYPVCPPPPPAPRISQSTHSPDSTTSGIKRVDSNGMKRGPRTPPDPEPISPPRPVRKEERSHSEKSRSSTDRPRPPPPPPPGPPPNRALQSAPSTSGTASNINGNYNVPPHHVKYGGPYGGGMSNGHSMPPGVVPPPMPPPMGFGGHPSHYVPGPPPISPYYAVHPPYVHRLLPIS